MLNRKPSRDGITLFEGNLRELDGKVLKPPGLQIAQYEGLRLWWEYERRGDVLVLLVEEGGETSDPILRIPLTESEAQLIRGCREKGGWGYYELKVEENDDRGAANVSFVNANGKRQSLLWIIDHKRRTKVSRGIDRFLEPEESLFGD